MQTHHQEISGDARLADGKGARWPSITVTCLTAVTINRTDGAVSIPIRVVSGGSLDPLVGRQYRREPGAPSSTFGSLQAPA